MKVRGRGLLGLACLALAPGLAAQTAPAARVTYTRSFQGSQPAFLEIVVGADGRAQYQAKENGADPATTLDFTATPATVRAIFGQAAVLGDFAGDKLQSRSKVAYTGDKMLAYDDGTRHAAQEFTYTQLPAATALVDLFEKISVAGMDSIRLRRALQYQPLDLLDRLREIQDDWNSHGMAEAEILVPTLEAVTQDPASMEAARHRAEQLLKEIGAAGKG